MILCMAHVDIELELHNINLPQTETNYGVVV